MLHDDLNHGGDVAFVDVRFGRDIDGSVLVDCIELNCPVCGALSIHPISGGCAPGPVQKLFLRTIIRRAVPLGIPAGQRTLTALKLLVRNRIVTLDGAGRFKLAAMTTEDDNPDA